MHLTLQENKLNINALKYSHKPENKIKPAH